MEIFAKFREAIGDKFKRHRKLTIGGLSVLLALGLVFSGIQFGILPIGSSQHGKVLTIGQYELVLTIGTASATTATDYTCDGTADDEQFTLAINALPNTGGKIEVLGGTYNFTATVSRAINNVTIEGVGVATYFSYGASAVFSAGSQSGWVFSNFSTSAGGINIASATSLTVWNVKVGSAYLQNRVNGFIATSALGTGTANSTSFLRGDQTWATVSGGSSNITGRTATYVVAASDALAHVKAQADYVCDGVADNVEIQAAIDALASHGGKVHLSQGIFSLSAALVIKTPMTLEGEGYGYRYAANLYDYGTVLRTAGTTDAIHITPDDVVQWGFTIRELCLDGNNVGVYGLSFNSYVTRSVFENLGIFRFTNFGIYENSNHSNLYLGCKIILNGTGAATTGGVCIIGSNVNNFIGCQIEWNGTGMIFRSGYGTSVIGCVIEGNQYHGIYGYSTPASGYYPQFIHIQNTQFEANNVAAAANIRDIFIADNGASHWRIENVKSAGTNVDFFIYCLGNQTTLKDVYDDFRHIYLLPDVNYPGLVLGEIHTLDASCLPLATNTKQLYYDW